MVIKPHFCWYMLIFLTPVTLVLWEWVKTYYYYYQF